MNATIERLREIEFSGLSAAEIDAAQQAVLFQANPTWQEYCREFAERESDRCPICGSRVRVPQCSNAYCVSHQLRAIAQGDDFGDCWDSRLREWDRAFLARLRADPSMYSGYSGYSG